uniref:Uncharacterized protein n=1 Tax=Meloidogyne enterolobii TaxID=390850 RepID=A0A6V7V7K1_MELEN|nr:unnamed protein product [Meloidogyne enterolobii]
MKILTSKLILPLLFLLTLDLKELDAGNSCKGQNATATRNQRPNKGKEKMKNEEQIGEDVLSTIHIYGSEGECKYSKVVGPVSL